MYQCSSPSTPTTIFAALADATRRDIVLRALNGDEGVAELAGHYPMSFAAVQKHVAVLERAGLVTKERTGRRKVVRTNIEGLRLARGLLDQYEALWRGRIDRMTDLITSTEETDRMTVTAVRKDPDTLTLTLTAEFEASPERVWQLWADPRQLERWWGPPDLPRDLHGPRPGARQPRRVPHDRARAATSRTASGTSSRPSRRAGSSSSTASRTTDGTPNDDFPRNEGRVTIEPIDAGRTRMSIESRFPSTAAMEQVLAMGMEEGLTQAVGQIDAILAEDASASPRPTRRSAPHDRGATMTTMTEPTTHPGGPGRHPDLRRPEGRTRPPRCCSSSGRRWARAGSGRWPATSPIARS